MLDEDFAAILMDVRMTGIDEFTAASMIRDASALRYRPSSSSPGGTRISHDVQSYRAGPWTTS